MSAGYDVSDFFLGGGKVEALLFEMDRLRASGDADDVLAAIEQMFLAGDDTALDHLAEGMTDEQIGQLDPPSFVVQGWLMRGFFSLLFGAPGVMKTFLILDVLRHVRAGSDWHGHATERGAVLLYEGEGLEQTQGRIRAWNERYPDADLAPSLSFERFVDLTRPEGVAAVVRTVRGFEARTGVKVQLVAIDPAVEFMTGDENGEGTEQLSRGLRALAQYLDIAVLVGHHTNASGERARGTDHLRMRAGAHIRVERVDDDMVGLLQEKQKNAAPLAMLLQPESVAGSLVLETVGTITAGAYMARKARAVQTERASARISMSETAKSTKDSKARALLLAAIRTEPGIVQGKLLRQVVGEGIGHDILLATLEQLRDSGALRFKRAGSAKNAGIMHWIADGADQ